MNTQDTLLFRTDFPKQCPPSGTRGIRYSKTQGKFVMVNPDGTEHSIGEDAPGGIYANVMDYGAVGNGIADDTVAIQAAMDSGHPVYFPAGTYKITDALVINRSHLRMFAAGLGGAKIVQATPDKDGIHNGGGHSYFEIEGIWVQGPGATATTGIGIDTGHATGSFTSRNSFKRVMVTKFATGIRIADTVLANFLQCQASSCTVDFDLDQADTVFMEAIGAGGSFGGGTPGETCIKAHNNQCVVINTLDGGNAARLLDIYHSHVHLNGGNIENLTAEGAIYITGPSTLEVTGHPRVLGNATTPNDAFIQIVPTGTFIPNVRLGSIDFQGSNWLVVCGTGPYFNLATVDPIGYCNQRMSWRDGSTVKGQAKIGNTRAYYNARWMSFDTEADLLTLQGCAYYGTRREDTTTYEEKYWFHCRDRWGAIRKYDLIPDNHRKVLGKTTASAGNTGSSATIAYTVAVPGLTVLHAGEQAVITAWGTTAANDNNKRIRVVWRASPSTATVIYDSGVVAWNDVDWRVECRMSRVSSPNGAWVASSVCLYTGGQHVQNITATQNLNNAADMEVELTGVADSDVVLDSAEIQWLERYTPPTY